MNLDSTYITPIQKINENINNNTFYLKREDLFPFSFGGNKARKALLFFKDFKSKNANCILTYGTSSSNHCRIISNLCASNNIPCYIISPLENSEQTVNSKIVNLLGSKIIFSSINDIKETINNTFNDLKNMGFSPYFIEGGGHGVLGTKAYVNVYNEILSYESQNNIFFDYIFLTSGTGTTQAGLICGKIINNDDRKIIGISNARKNPYGSEVVLASVNDYLNTLGRSLACDKEVTYITDFVLDGYGSYNVEILNTIKEVLRNEGVPLDTTYTGKSYWGMKSYLYQHGIKDKNILFIHTGGTPLFFEDLEEL